MNARVRAEQHSLPAGRRRGVLITTLVVSLVAAAFYVGFIVMMVLRATHP